MTASIVAASGRSPSPAQAELSRRWHMSHRTLEQWRWKKIGPRYLKIGGRVLYCLEDIEEYEAARRREVS